MASSIRYEPDYAVAPGRTLRSTLQELGLTQADLAERTGISQKHVNQIIQGVAPITPDTALRFERVTNVPARAWNLLEANYRGRLVRRDQLQQLAAEAGWLDELPIKELIHRGFLTANADKPVQVEEACRFFAVADPERWRQLWLRPLASFRQSTRFAADAGAVATWIRLGELEATEIETAPFDAKSFREVLRQARQLTQLAPPVALVQLRKNCAAAGVALVFLPEVGETRACGAARWLTPAKAMILLSDRFKSDDQFWFSFFHEAGHLLLHSKKDLFISGSDGDNVSEQEEEEANAFAASQLIPKRYEAALPDLQTEQDVQRFASEIGIAPGIVVGRLHKESLWAWNRGNRMRKKIAFDDLFPGS
ncbi:MAG: XRE family transcriptional regulator [Gaiellaceae bacterium]